MDLRGTCSNPPPLLEGLLNYYCPTSSHTANAATAELPTITRNRRRTNK
jgi:hypothetical protein